MEFLDKVLKCIECGQDFIFTAGEQLFFHDKQFKNEPRRCKNCKSKRSPSFGPVSTSNMVARGKSNPEGFTVIFDWTLSAQQMETTLIALADHYRACGGVGFAIEWELENLKFKDKRTSKTLLHNPLQPKFPA